MDAHSLYTSHYYSQDPAVDESWSGRAGTTKVFCTSEICDYGKLTDSEFYNEFFLPNGIHHVMVLAIRPDYNVGERLIVGFHRPKSDPAFSEAEKRRTRRLGGALSCALRNLTLQDELKVRNQAIDEYESAHPETGIAFFDDHMSLIYGNRKGLDDLHLSSSGGHGESARQRLATVSQACRELNLSQEMVTPRKLDFSEGEDLVAMLQLRKDPAGRPMFSVQTSERVAEALFGQKIKEWGMTTREVDIIRLLRAGLSNAEIAMRLFISIRTVENHLRSIYGKAGVNRRTQLLHALMA